MSQAHRPVLVVGSFREETMRRVREAATAVGCEADAVTRCEDARVPLGALTPAAVVLRMDAPGAASVCAFVRMQARLADVPILGVSAERPDLAFTELFSWGADDLVSLWTPQGLERRLRPLAHRPAAVEARGEGAGTAIVAGVDAHWRSVMGRALYSGGFSVRFAMSHDDLVAESKAPGVRLVVVADDVTAEGAVGCVVEARAQGSEAAWVVVAPPKRMAGAHAALADVPRVALADGFAPPENVLFLANELLARRGVDKRASARLLYGTAVSFRVAGREQDEVGFSYNVSAGGLYVRTLAPLDGGAEVWLEMWAPRSERRVRLEGKVAWKRPFGSSERATVPAGFGVRITGGLGGDLERWHAGYEALAESLLGVRSRAPSAPEM